MVASMNLTKTYPFHTMQIGDSFTVSARFQHARVAASEYARRHNMVFTCRVQDDDTMIIYRVAQDQAKIDQRGRSGRRRITNTIDPTAMQFGQWLAGFQVGQSYTMPSSYSHLYTAMIAWSELYSLRSGRSIVASMNGGALLINRLS